MQVVNTKEDFDNLNEQEKAEFSEHIRNSSLKIFMIDETPDLEPEDEGYIEPTYGHTIDYRLCEKFGISKKTFSQEGIEEAISKVKGEQ